MFKRWLVLAAALLACAIGASPAAAGTNTGWPCTVPNQWVNLGGGNAYYCRPSTMTWWLIQAPWAAV